ncbi:MAG: hypothetical protein LC687_03355, partial [Actinobacteria bacterium]|nr:hypothetical protein [Actinomycetota bacterium]
MPHVTISPVEGRLDVQTEWSDKELVKECIGTYWDEKRRTWHSPKTLAAMLQLRDIFGQRMTYSDEVEEWIRPVKERSDYARYLARLVDPGSTIDGLFPWQVGDYQWAWTVIGPGGGALLGNDQGTGKTVSAAVILANLEDALPAL